MFTCSFSSFFFCYFIFYVFVVVNIEDPRFLQQPGKTGKMDFTLFPADLVDHEALPRGRFALFSSSVYEDLFKRHIYIYI